MDHSTDTFILIFFMIMITTLIINFHRIHTLQSHHMHVVTIPCSISTLRYQRPSPREPVWTRLFPDIVSLTLLYSTFLRMTFDFFLKPSPLTFLRHFSFLLMTSFSDTFSFVFIISESPVHEGCRRDYFCLYLYFTDARRSTVPLPVSNVSYCISSHSSYYLSRHFINYFRLFCHNAR